MTSLNTLKSICFAACVNFLFPCIPCFLQNESPCAAKTESNLEYFVTIFFMKPHDLFTRPVTNPPNPFHTSTLIQTA